MGPLVFAKQGRKNKEEYPAYLVLGDPNEKANKAKGLVLVKWADRKEHELVPSQGVRMLDDDSGGRRGRRRNAAPAPAPAPKKAPAKKKVAAKHPPPKAKATSKSKLRAEERKKKKKLSSSNDIISSLE